MRRTSHMGKLGEWNSTMDSVSSSSKDQKGGTRRGGEHSEGRENVLERTELREPQSRVKRCPSSTAINCAAGKKEMREKRREY